MTYLTEQMALTALTIRKDTESMGMSCHTVQRLDRLWKEFSLLLATIELPKEPTGSIHEQEGPPR